jgi:sugar lactone lactonase YvrE
MNLRCIFQGGDQLGETPLWCERTETLWWIDIEKPRLQSLDTRTGQHRAHVFTDATFLGSLAMRSQGGFLLALDRSLHVFDPANETLALFAHVEPADAHTRLNDGRTDRQGRFWVGAMDLDLVNPRGSLYCVQAGGAVSQKLSGIKLPNSIGSSPDGRTLYCSDTRSYVLWAMDLDPATGEISRRRVLKDFSATRDRPDGLCVDAEGYLWLAIFGGARILRLAPDGTVVRVVELPVTNPTCMCLGGPQLRTLYITTARKYLDQRQIEQEPWSGALLAMEVDVPGLVESRFAG